MILSWEYSKKFTKKLLHHDIDVIFAPSAMTQIAFLNTDIPIIYLSDATIRVLKNYYPAFKGFANTLEGDLLEKLAISKASTLVFSSQWAAQSAIEDYGADPGKVHIVPFGANLDNIPETAVVLERRRLILHENQPKSCRLLFLAVDWDRKGGQIAFDTLLELKKLGLDAELVVCGCTPPKSIQHENMLVVSSLNKNSKSEAKRLEELLFNADFLLLPTRADCSPIVFCEASAFGVPIITTDTGGISGIITNGKNGFMLPLEAKGREYAEVIYSIFNDKDTYLDLVQASRKLFDETLNWDAWATTLNQLIFNHIPDKKL